jgi:nucleotidyltransferase AbiEii toxin of type IV toxin-antitoxin system
VTLAERIVALHEALTVRGLPHAFGGAIALAYATANPRGTDDIDINVFVPPERAEEVLSALPEAVERPPGVVERIARDGQTRLLWEIVPVDLFFDYAPVHADAAANRRMVPFAGTEIPVLGPVELAVFKIMFDRPQDWVDVASMLEAESLDVAAVRAALEPMLAPDDHRFARLAEVVG